MKLTKLLLEYPGAFTPRPKEEWDKNQEEIEKRREEERRKREPKYIIEQYIENGSVGDLEINGKFHNAVNLFTLPDNLTVNGNLTLIGCRNLIELPKNLTVEGSFFLQEGRIKYLPDDIKIRDSFVCYECPLEYIPDNFSIEGTLELVYTRVNEIPYNLKIGKDFNIDFAPLMEKYRGSEIEKIVKDRGGQIVGEVNACPY